MPEPNLNPPPHPPGALRLCLCCALLFTAAASAPARAALCRQDAPRQSSAGPDDAEVSRGKELLAQGKTKEAVAVLLGATKRLKDDPEPWHYLGVAYNHDGAPREARKAFERALELRPDYADSLLGLAYALANSNRPGDAERQARRARALEPQNREAHYVLGVVALRAGRLSEALAEADAALLLDQDYAQAHLLKSQALVALSAERPREPAGQPDGTQNPRLRQAADSLEEFLKRNPARAGDEAWREQLDALRVYSQSPDIADPGRTVFSMREVDQKAVILSKPEPSYTERARQNGTEGVIRLRAVLAADGTVRHILVLRGLPDGLTESCVRAARAIKFTPAVKDDRPASMVVMLEYNFNVY